MTELNKIPARMVLRAGDIQNIAGVSLRTAQRILHKIRKAQGKKNSDFITTEDFCNHYGLKEERISQYMK